MVRPNGREAASLARSMVRRRREVDVVRHRSVEMFGKEDALPSDLDRPKSDSGLTRLEAKLEENAAGI